MLYNDLPVSVFSWTDEIPVWDLLPERLVKTKDCAGVPTVYGAVRDDTRRAMVVMQYFPCGDLESFLMAHIRLSLEWKHRFVQRLLTAMDSIARRGVVVSVLSQRSCLLLDAHEDSKVDVRVAVVDHLDPSVDVSSKADVYDAGRIVLVSAILIRQRSVCLCVCVCVSVCVSIAVLPWHYSYACRQACLDGCCVRVCSRCSVALCHQR
jgi:hypothetical protein